MLLSFANGTTSADSLSLAPLCEMVLAPTAILQQELSALLDDRNVDRRTSQALRCDIHDRVIAEALMQYVQVGGCAAIAQLPIQGSDRAIM